MAASAADDVLYRAGVMLRHASALSCTDQPHQLSSAHTR